MEMYPTPDDNEEPHIHFEELREKLQDFPTGELLWFCVKIGVILWFVNGLAGEIYHSFIKTWWG